ncbi:hypothetical protein M3Y97_00424600 [Aphelenchoides bicaudatus]|nr:hypothetical protein M3Y97_00424600 [Aphelenchoides bicaudatus]
MANLNKSTLFPGGESTGDQRKSMGNSHFFNSRATFRKFGASKGMGLGSTNMRSEHIRTTLKHDLMKSRILDAEMCDGLKDSAIREELFSTSEAVRAPQTEIEFMMRARNAEVSEGKDHF